MKLQILVPQYNETEDIIKGLLDSIAIQQCVDLNDVGVIICNDGSDTLLSLDFLHKYPFYIKYYKEPHRGVSGTRNACLDHSFADYVMFCDADDMFLSTTGLFDIFSLMNKDGGFNVLHSLFIEQAVVNNQTYLVDHKNDLTFVHGKVYKRMFLQENNIRWDEELTIHEDSYFNILAASVAKEVQYVERPFYLWRYRKESICRNDPKYLLKTYPKLVDSNAKLVIQLLNRGFIDLAQQYCVQMFFEVFYTLNKAQWLDKKNKIYKDRLQKRFKEYYDQFQELFYITSDDVKQKVIIGVKSRVMGEGIVLEKMTFDSWINRIKKIK